MKRVTTDVKHNLDALFREVRKLYPDLSDGIANLYRKNAQFRYPDSSWIPTREDIEKFFRPIAKKILDYGSGKINW